MATSRSDIRVKIRHSLSLEKILNMDLQTRKLEFIQEFLKISSEEAISKFEALLNRQKGDPQNPFTKDEMIDRIKQSESDFKNGRFKTTDELLEKFQ